MNYYSVLVYCEANGNGNSSRRQSKQILPCFDILSYRGYNYMCICILLDKERFPHGNIADRLSVRL